MLRSICIVACVAALSACAASTSYSPAPSADGEGYREVLLEPERWRVEFAGNTLTSREQVETFLLYRAAELTVAKGYDYFIAVDRATDAREQLHVQSPHPNPRWSPVWRYRYGTGWRSWGDDAGLAEFDARRVTAYLASAEIFMQRGHKPVDDLHAYDARAVMVSLGDRVHRPLQPGSTE